MRIVLFWVIMHRVMVISYRRFGTTYRSHRQASRINPWPLKTGPIGCPETSVRNYHFSLRNDAEERISPLYFGLPLLPFLSCSSACFSSQLALRPATAAVLTNLITFVIPVVPVPPRPAHSAASSCSTSRGTFRAYTHAAAAYCHNFIDLKICEVV